MAVVASPPKKMVDEVCFSLSKEIDGLRQRFSAATTKDNIEVTTVASLDHSPGIPFSEAMECHVCQRPLGLLNFRHSCRNCGKSVCGSHSKNQLPLPEYGLLKEVRVCDVCYQQKVQRRAGAPPGTGGLNAASNVSRSNDAKYQRQVSHGTSLCGILYSGLVEEQDDVLNEMLYLGSFRLGSRSMASRKFNPNIAIWMERMFMLTPAEMLCFKPQKEKEDFLLGIGEVKTSIHMTDILHTEIDANYPRILTVVRSDGR
jgi:hypothetical protein